ncbi:MAG: nucleotidyltransferase substrate binding protein [Treponema sp.]|nr:nucleotidyltransferase substrate binding protein [Treponema sp.]
MNKDIRWKQRFRNYKKALTTVKHAVELAKSRELSALEKQGAVKSFEFTFELAWNMMKDYLEEQGIAGIIGSKNAIRHAFSNGILENEQIWMEMVKSRNISSHTYDETTAQMVLAFITGDFYDAFAALEQKMETLE